MERSSMPRPAAADGSQEGGGRAPGLRVLVVDDNADSTETMAMLLSLWGHDTRTAMDGTQALALAAEHRPDVVLLDIGLPGLTGYEVAVKMRQMDTLAHTVLVAMTGYGEAQDKKRSREAGFTVHLVKPVQPDALQTLLAGIDAHRPQRS